MLKLYGFSSLSLLAIDRVAERVPAAEGSNVIWKVEELFAAIDAEGMVVTLKSAAFVPLMVIYGEVPVSDKAEVPIF
jgi:hypothetical protein